MSKFDAIFDRRKNDTRKWNTSLIKKNFNMQGDVIPMDIADLDFPVAPSIVSAIQDRANKRDYSYTSVSDEFYQAICDWSLKRFNTLIKPEWIKLEYGTVPALHHLIQLLTEKNDQVLFNVPAYDPFEEAVIHSDRNSLHSQLKLVNNRYEIDWKDLEGKLAQPKTKLFIFCNPQNPSGRVWTYDEVAKISRLCHEYQVILIADEVHRDLVFKRENFTSIMSLPNTEQTILCVSPNKAFNLGGLKTSYLVVSDKKLRQNVFQGLTKFSVTSPNNFALPAILAAYKNETHWLDEMVDYIKGNQEFAERFITKKIPTWVVMPSDSSFLMWIDVHKMLPNDEEIDKFCQIAKVAVVKGSYFVEGGNDFIRLNLGCSRKILEKALNRFYDVAKNWI